MSEFILVKNNLSTKTRSIKAVAFLRKLGWKHKPSKLGNLL